MIPINGKPIIEHNGNHSKFGFKDFYLALGYKSEVKNIYDYEILNSNFKVIW